MSRVWSAEAPSNIALIKYMGKTDPSSNVPANPSLSYTLNGLLTRVEVELKLEGEDEWQPLEDSNWIRLDLSAKGQSRFLNHWKFLKSRLSLDGSYLIRSANNFPSDCGLASSASSFAALTMAAYTAALDQGAQNDLSLSQLADLSRQGSGSSCRSLFSPWAFWDDAGCDEIELPYPDLIHRVLIVDSGKKDVSSSDAHRRVISSLLFNGRVERAQQRLDELTDALRAHSWRQAFETVWAEFWDMHALFETSSPPFGYMSDKSLAALNMLKQQWDTHADGPLVTMDAGANIHLLYRQDQTELVQTLGANVPAGIQVYGSGQ